MEKEKKEISKKSKTSDVIIFTPQELVDLGILQNIHQVQQSPDIKSKANKKRIIEVIQKSIIANKEQPSTSKSPQTLPVVNSLELKRNLMGKLSSPLTISGSTKKETSKSKSKVINSEIALPKIPLSGKSVPKSPDAGILIPSSVNKKLKKKARNVDTTSVTMNRSILNKDERIKEIIMSAVRSNSKDGCSSISNILKETKPSKSNTIQNESLSSLSNLEETMLSIDNKTSSEKVAKMTKINVLKEDIADIKIMTDNIKTKDQDMASKVLQIDTEKDKNKIIKSKAKCENIQNNFSMSDIEETNINFKSKTKHTENRSTVDERKDTEVFLVQAGHSGKKEIKVFSNTQVSLSIEQLKHLIRPQIDKDDPYNDEKVQVKNVESSEKPSRIIGKGRIYQESENENYYENTKKVMNDTNTYSKEHYIPSTSKNSKTDMVQLKTNETSVVNSDRGKSDLVDIEKDLVVKKIGTSGFEDDSRQLQDAVDEFKINSPSAVIKQDEHDVLPRSLTQTKENPIPTTSRLDKPSLTKEDCDWKTNLKRKYVKNNEKSCRNKSKKEEIQNTVEELKGEDFGREIDPNLVKECFASDEYKTNSHSQSNEIVSVSDENVLEQTVGIEKAGINLMKNKCSSTKNLLLTSELNIKSECPSNIQDSNLENNRNPIKHKHSIEENDGHTFDSDVKNDLSDGEFKTSTFNFSKSLEIKIPDEPANEEPVRSPGDVGEIIKRKVSNSEEFVTVDLTSELKTVTPKKEENNELTDSANQFQLVNRNNNEICISEGQLHPKKSLLDEGCFKILAENIRASEVKKTNSENMGLSKEVLPDTSDTCKILISSQFKKKRNSVEKKQETLEDESVCQSEIVSNNEVVAEKLDKVQNNQVDLTELNNTPSTETCNESQPKISDLSSSNLQTNVMEDFTDEGYSKKFPYSERALHMLVTVGKKLNYDNAKELTSVERVEHKGLTKHCNPTNEELTQPQPNETYVKVPKKRGRPPKKRPTQTVSETEIEMPVVTKVKKITLEKVSLLGKGQESESSVNKNLNVLVNEIKTTTEMLEKADTLAGPSAKQSSTSFGRISEIKEELKNEEIEIPRKTEELQDLTNEAVKAEHNLDPLPVDTMEQRQTKVTNETSINDNQPFIQVPRKRGRPRKNPLDPPKPKKPKNDFSNESILDNSMDNINMDTVEMGVSKSGRKRRKINYFNLENSFMEEFSDTKSKSFSSDTDEEKKPVKHKKRKISVEVSIQDSEKQATDDSIENFEDLEEKPSISANNDSVESLDSSQAEENMELVVDKKIELKTEDGSDVEAKQNKIKTKRYNWTGETQRMMQSIFSAAMKASTPQSDKNEDGSSQQDNKEKETPPPALQATPLTTKNRGRPKKAQLCTTVIVDNDGKVKCCTCNTKVVNKEWQSHNRNVHYNLAWREGEPFLSVDDHIFIRRTLMPILHEDKSLVCSNCNKEFHVANEFIVHREECLGIVKNNKVICAICTEEIEQVKWLPHKKKKHNNLTWRVGDPPLDLNNQDLVVTVLNALYKAKIPLYCYKCRETKKSVVGFLSHQSQCGVDVENAKIPCPLCGKRILPVSLPSHNKLVHEPKPPKTDLMHDMIDDGPGSNKRKAAKQAMKMIDILSKAKLETIFSLQYVESPNLKEEEFVLKLLKEELKENDLLKCKFENCDFQHKEWEQIVDHLDECPQKPEQYFVCKKCFSIFLLEEEVRNHVRDKHNVNLRDDTDYVDNANSDGEDEEKQKQALARVRRLESQQTAKNTNIRVKPRFVMSLPNAKNRLCPVAFEYTLEFYNEHYTESVLFDRLRYLESDWNLLNDELLEEYIPKIEQSCLVTTKLVPTFDNMLKRNHGFNTLELFEVVEEEGGSTMFCGGPVTAMTWLPTPHILLYCRQVLAVSVAKDFDSKYLVNMNYNEPCIIQFWDFGVLKKKINPQKPKFLFGLTINYGPIWHMEWCPSGCYDEKVFNNNRLQRMGLLAVAGSVPTVNIYSIPFMKNDDDLHLVYSAKPLVRLQLFREYDNTKAKCFPTRISWSKASGHRYVAVGYTDGMVAIFDIETTSDILKFKDELDVETILPYKTLKAHTHYISVLSLIHLGGGARYLLTGSFDRNVCVWDLTDNSYSLLPRRKILSDGTWLTNWVAYATTADESNTNNAAASTCVASHRNYMYEVTHMVGSPASLTSLSSSDWLNGLLQGTTSGEILVTFPGQLLYGLDNDKRLKSLRWLLGYTKLINLSLSPEERIKEYEEEKKLTRLPAKNADCDRYTAAYIFNQGDKLKKYQPHTYEKAIERYGLVICDIKRKSFEEVAKFDLPNVLEPSRPDLYPLQAVNKVAFNPNSQSSLYFAAGYQAGFVRLRYMKFLENDKQVV